VAISVPPFEAGKAVSASALNALRAAVLAGREITAGPGVTITQTPTGAVISVLTGFEDWKRGVIEAASGTTPTRADALTYTVKVVGVDEVVLGMVPTIARVGKGLVKLHPAVIGDPCYVLRVPVGDGTFSSYLWAMTESLAFGTCDGPVVPVP